MSQTATYSIQFIVVNDEDENIITGFDSACVPPYKKGQVIYIEIYVSPNLPEKLRPTEQSLTTYEIIDIEHGLRNAWKLKIGNPGEIELRSYPKIKVYLKKLKDN